MKKSLEMLEFEKKMQEYDSQAEFMKVIETDKLKAKEDGSNNKAIEIAKKMLSTDASIDYIAEMTGLSKEKINSLK